MPTPNDFADYRFEPNRNAAGGDFSPVADAPGAPLVPAGTYPNAEGYGYDASNRQFSSDASGDPQALATQTAQNRKGCAELQQFLMTNFETAGSRICHPVEKLWQPPSGAVGE